MDHFGIGSALQAMWRMYCATSRRSGRTTSLVDSVKDGDRVVVLTAAQAQHLERLIAERRVSVQCIVVEPHAVDRLFERGTSEGRTIFDHAWLEAYYLMKMESAAERIDHLERELSGFGAAHRETHRRAIELARFR